MQTESKDKACIAFGVASVVAAVFVVTPLCGSAFVKAGAAISSKLDEIEAKSCNKDQFSSLCLALRKK